MISGSKRRKSVELVKLCSPRKVIMPIVFWLMLSNCNEWKNRNINNDSQTLTYILPKAVRPCSFLLDQIKCERQNEIRSILFHFPHSEHIPWLFCQITTSIPFENEIFYCVLKLGTILTTLPILHLIETDFFTITEKKLCTLRSFNFFNFLCERHL